MAVRLRGRASWTPGGWSNCANGTRATPTGASSAVAAGPNQAVSSTRQRRNSSSSSASGTPSTLQESRCRPGGAYSGAMTLNCCALLMKASGAGFKRIFFVLTSGRGELK